MKKPRISLHGASGPEVIKGRKYFIPKFFRTFCLRLAPSSLVKTCLPDLAYRCPIQAGILIDQNAVADDTLNLDERLKSWLSAIMASGLRSRFKREIYQELFAAFQREVEVEHDDLLKRVRTEDSLD